MRRFVRVTGIFALCVSVLSLSGCAGTVGVGVSVGVPVGTHGYMSVGASRWR
jgi:hypothetical protein